MDMYQIALLVIGTFLGLVLSPFLSKYFGEKGKNLATKSDIADITTMIEASKSLYAQKLESVRAELSGLVARSGHRYQKEYEILVDLTSKLVALRDAALALRPVLDYVEIGKSEDELKKERLAAFQLCNVKLFNTTESKRPFFPQQIYDKIKAIQSHA